MLQRLPLMLRTSLAAALLLSAIGGCGADSSLPRYDKGYVGNETPLWPDYGPIKQDLYVPPRPDAGTTPDGSVADSRPADSGGGADGSASCPPPTGASCTPACPSGQLCTPAKGGICAKVIQLSGPASNKGVLKAVALGYLECWKKAPKQDTLCNTFNSCKMTGTLTETMVTDWVCKSATVSDFSSATEFKDVKAVCGCGILDVYRADWKITSVGSNKQGDVCLSYNVVSLWYDDVEVNNCNKFPPK